MKIPTGRTELFRHLSSRCVKSVPPRAVYTHYTSRGAARLCRIYVTSNISGQKVGVETVFAALQIIYRCDCESIWKSVSYNEAGSVDNEY